LAKTFVGFSVSEETVGSGGGAGVTVSEPIGSRTVSPEMVTVVDAATALVLTVNVALVVSATVTLEVAGLRSCCCWRV